MIRVNQITSFVADPLDRDNYQTVAAWNPQDPCQQLRVDAKQKFYILTQSNQCIKKVFDAVINFFIKWVREGWSSDETLAGRIEIPMQNALINGYLRTQVTRIARTLFDCTGIPLSDDPTVRETFQRDLMRRAFDETVRLMTELPAIRNRINGQCKEALDQIGSDLMNLSCIPADIESRENFPNQVPRQIRDIFQLRFYFGPG
jgi:hypothetical protein